MTLEEREEIVILFWTKYFEKSAIVDDGTQKIILNGSVDDDRKPFLQCKNRCRLTNNRSLLPNSSAVIFHIPDLDLQSDMPQFRSPQQRWIFYILESPVNSRKKNELFTIPEQFDFNWTMTYR
jgi:hypothetical protein